MHNEQRASEVVTRVTVLSKQLQRRQLWFSATEVVKYGLPVYIPK